jgi:putative CocE/NonD family hydrolase
VPGQAFRTFRRAIIGCVACLALSLPAIAQEFRFPAASDSSQAEIDAAIAVLARQLLTQLPSDGAVVSPGAKFRRELAAGRYAESLATYSTWRSQSPAAKFDGTDLLALYARAKRGEVQDDQPFDESLRDALTELLAPLDDHAALRVEYLLRAPAGRARDRLERLLAARKGEATIDAADADELIDAWLGARAMMSFAPALDFAFASDDARRYAIQDDVLIRTREGATLSAVVVKSRGQAKPVPAILYFTIYTDLGNNRYQAKVAAASGYAGVSADARGKRLSRDRIMPWEHEVRDTWGVIDWISRQAWCDGQVGMHGSSYLGFAQWAAAKSLHPALKTIIPAVASTPGFGLPMQNNVFLYANYAWPFYVMNNRLLDEASYNDDRWTPLPEKWFASGRPWRDIDAVDGTPNELLQRQLRHPSYDEYWQAMQPYEEDYARINIPVLSLTGYYDDASAGAVNYVVEHYRYNPRANHYLVLGPYDHVTTKQSVKPAVVRGYEIDPVAQLDSIELMFQWFDHVLRGAARPAILRDRINFQVMGANVWRHAPSIESMSDGSLTLYLTEAKSGEYQRLAPEKPPKPGFLEQMVDFADRTTQDSLYPTAAIIDEPPPTMGFVFVSEPFDAGVSVNGLIKGRLRATVNKRDVDFTIAVYEWMPDGRLFNLSYYLGRASYAHDMSMRKLLTPGVAADIPFERTPPISRQLSEGSRLLVLLTVNKSAWAQVNHGTGKDVSDESVADAGEPLRVRWHNDSYVVVPIQGESGERSGPSSQKNSTVW